MSKVDILAIGIHPDDVELSCSGTLARQISLGNKVGILDLTKGELGTRGNAELRTKEAMASAKLLGVEFRNQLDLKDGFFMNNEESLKEIIREIRACQPDIVLCNAVSDRHPDHGRSAKLASEACFYSGLVKIKTKLNGVEQQAWRPKAVYHYIQDRFIDPDFVVDVSDFMQVKRDAILCFASQFYDPNSNEPETPISGKDFLDSVEAKMALFGRLIAAKFGEGFTKERAIGVKDLGDLF